MVSKEQSAELIARLEAELPMARGRDQAGRCVVTLLNELPHFDWTGIYWLEGDSLELGPFVGEPTEHTSIPVGTGVCGTAVAENANQVIADVRDLDNYLACSLTTRSEIVVLIRDQLGEVVGQIDVDGSQVGAFDTSDEELLEAFAARFSQVL